MSPNFPSFSRDLAQAATFCPRPDEFIFNQFRPPLVVFDDPAIGMPSVHARRPRQNRHASPPLNLPQPSRPPLAPAAAPLCYVVDEEPSIRQFLSLVLHGAGIDTVEFADGAALRKAAADRLPDLILSTSRSTPPTPSKRWSRSARAAFAAPCN